MAPPSRAPHEPSDAAPDAAPAPGLRARNRARTRALLLDAALALFVRQGYDATSIDEIAARAGVGRMTFFNHFPHKEDLLLAWVATRRERLRQALLAAAARELPARERIRAAFGEMTALYEGDGASRPLLAQWVRTGGPLSAHASDSAKLLAAVIQEGQRRGELRSDAQARTAGAALLDLYLGALYRWAAEPAPAPGALTRAVRAATDLLFRGLAPGE